MAQIESFPALAASDLAGTDVFYVRRVAQPSGSRDAKFSFSTIARALFAAADKPTARVGLGFLTATASLDFPSINAVSQADLTIVLAGAVIGDAVILGPPAAPVAGLIFFAFVSAPNVVTVRASNITASPVNESAMNFRIIVVTST